MSTATTTRFEFAVAWINGKTFLAPTCELDVYDRVGGGDGFAAGSFYALLTGESEEEAVKLGLAHGALLTTFPGDTTKATVEQVRTLRQRRLGENPKIIQNGRAPGRQGGGDGESR